MTHLTPSILHNASQNLPQTFASLSDMISGAICEVYKHSKERCPNIPWGCILVVAYQMGHLCVLVYHNHYLSLTSRFWSLRDDVNRNRAPGTLVYFRMLK